MGWINATWVIAVVNANDLIVPVNIPGLNVNQYGTQAVVAAAAVNR